MEFIFNGQSSGGNSGVGAALLKAKGDPRALRPYVIQQGGYEYSYIDVQNQLKGGQDHSILTNSTATLLKDEWQLVDEVVLKVAKQRLRANADLRQAGLIYSIPEGMGKTVLQYQAQSDITGATIAMDPRVQSQEDRPVYDLLNLPLPLIMKDFSFGIRELMESRNRGLPLDVETAALAARRVTEEAEQLLIGTLGTYSYGGGTIYGYTNFPQRMTKVMTDPTTGGWTPLTTISEVLDMRTQSMLEFHYGPWMLYTSPLWEAYLDNDYSSAKGDRTLRERLKVINGIIDVRTLDYLTNNSLPYQMLMVQMDAMTVRSVIGMDIVTVQWNTMGDMESHFKVMCIIVPQLRYDHNGNTGIVHGSAA